MTQNKIKVVILGASGYAGGDLIRMLSSHKNVDIVALSANAKSGISPSKTHSSLFNTNLPEFIKTEDINYDGIDLVFSALPHDNLHNLISQIPELCKVIDLSADFRFSDVNVFNKYYETSHKSPDLAKKSVYGLSEIFKDDIKRSRIVACPGCYPTAVLLPLIPLLRSKIISIEDLIIDAKSGVTGAGRGNKEELMFSEVSESLKPYNIARHRHTPEIEELIKKTIGSEVKINFTPHLVPINRGELVTVYAKTLEKHQAKDAISCLKSFYKNDFFVNLSNEDYPSETSNVRGSNNCLISIFDDRIEGRLIIVATIDNLIKGSSGQAIQNMNIMFGFDEKEGLPEFGLYP